MADNSTLIMNEEDINRTLTRLAHEIMERNKDLSDLVIVGIVTRGEEIGKRLAEKIAEIEGKPVAHGTLDITLFRDDYDTRVKVPTKQTELPIIKNKTVILADDVLFTGRTIRAALDGLMQYGRPRRVQLAILIDRGHRELPVKADYIGKNIPTSLTESVQVELTPYDEKNEVILIQAAKEN